MGEPEKKNKKLLVLLEYELKMEIAKHFLEIIRFLKKIVFFHESTNNPFIIS